MRHSCAPFCLLIFYLVAAISCCAQDREDEIVANLAGGQVIVHVAKDAIVFAAIDHPVERNSIPPRVLALDSTHIAVLFGASEWRIPSDPKPVRLDRNFQRIAAKDPRYQSAPGEAEPDLETIGVAFLEKLRPLVGQLHHKLDFSSDEPILQVVIIGYAPTTTARKCGSLNIASSRSKSPRAAITGRRASFAHALLNSTRRKTCAAHDRGEPISPRR